MPGIRNKHAGDFLTRLGFVCRIREDTFLSHERDLCVARLVVVRMSGETRTGTDFTNKGFDKNIELQKKKKNGARPSKNTTNDGGYNKPG